MEHPPDPVLQAYAGRTLPPADLLEVDDHLAGCDACRSRTATFARGAGWAQLPDDLLPVESHLSDEQVGDYATGRAAPAARAEIDRHLNICATCAREVSDLRGWARSRATRPTRWAYAAAAAVVLALLAPFAARWWPGEPTSRVGHLDALPSAEQEQVRAALQAGFAEPPAFLAELRGEPEALMGTPEAPSFRLTAPLGTVVASDRPAFRWEPLAGARAYRVLVVDAELRPLLSSPQLSQPSWTADQGLPRGRVYAWQVTALRGEESVTAPAPPAPPARFRVLDQPTADLLQRTAREHPDAHLVLGLLSTRAGLIEEARQQLSAVSSDDPHFEVARRTLDRLD